MDTFDIVLAGAGHTHAGLVRTIPSWRERGWTVAIVAPGPFVYSGMATGVLAGRYPDEANRIDLSAIAERLGARAVRRRVTAVDTRRRRISLEGGDRLAFRTLSLNLGSGVCRDGITSEGPTPILSKPVANLAVLRATLDAEDADSVIVVGGGAAGVEIACCLAGRIAGAARTPSIRLISGAPILPGWPERGRRLARERLREADIAVFENRRATAISAKRVFLEDGGPVDADIVVAATGVKPNRLESEMGPEAGPLGGLAVDATLQSRTAPGVFICGDLADFDPPLDRIGVHAVKEAKVLAKNITACLEGRKLRPYRPQRRYLQILNLGDGTGLLRRGGFVLRARWADWLKDRLDRGFLDKVSSGVEAG